MPKMKTRTVDYNALYQFLLSILWYIDVTSGCGVNHIDVTRGLRCKPFIRVLFRDGSCTIG